MLGFKVVTKTFDFQTKNEIVEISSFISRFSSKFKQILQKIVL